MEKLVAKYLSGNITASEENKLKDWMQQHPDNEKQFRDFEKMWKHSDLQNSLESADTDEEWLKLKEKLQAEGNISGKVVEIPFNKLRQNYFYYAAAIAVFVMLGYLSQVLFQGEEQEVSESPEVQEILEEQLVIIEGYGHHFLPDSTEIWLDSSSSLTIACDFEDFERQVTLVGHAFFEVKRDTTCPFVIFAENTRTEVLGTSFDLRAMKGDSTVEISVVTGKVMFSGLTGEKQSVILLPTQKGVFDKELASVEKEEPKNDELFAWKKARQSVKKRRLKPRHLFGHHFTWKKNKINQTIIEGEIINNTSNINYRSLKLNITFYTEKRGEVASKSYVIKQGVKPGEHISYKKTLLKDWLKNTSNVEVDIEGVE